LADINADWLVVGLWEKDSPSGAAAHLDTSLGGILTKLRAQGDAVGKAKELTPLYQCAGIAAKRVLLVGLGARDKADFASLVSATAAAAKLISGKTCRRVALTLPDVPSLSADAVLRACAHGFFQGSSSAGIRKKENERTPPAEIAFVVLESDAILQSS